MKSYDSIWDTIITMSSNTSFTGSWSGFSRSTKLASSVCLSPLDSLPSKTCKWALKFEVFCVFHEKNYEKRKKVMKFLTGLCQDDVTTSSDDVISRKKLYSHVRDKILGKSHRRNFQNLLWFRSYAAKSRPGGKFTPPPPWFYVC